MALNRVKIRRIAVETCRVIMALTFIFSGFVKVVDPWGSAIKFGEYFSAFNMDWLYGWRFFFAIWITGAEMMMGCMVLFRVRLRLTSLFMFCAMIFFTCLTFVLAVWNPVEDCGCFGDAIKLTNWETFIKNLILLPMSFVVFWTSRKLPWKPTWRDGAFMLLFGGIAFGIGVYSYRHLPLIDFLPYKEGTDLAAAVNYEPEENEVETILIYRNVDTGKIREFDITDTEWDSDEWEFVDTKTTYVNINISATLRDFAIMDNDGLVTDEILDDPGIVYMLCVSNMRDLRPRCQQRMESAVAQAHARGYRVICLTAESLGTYPELVLGNEHVPCYNMDATTLKTMLRAKTGVVVLKAGVIVDKENCRDLLRRKTLPEY